MTGLVTQVIDLLRDRKRGRLGSCPVCRRAVMDRTPRVRLHGGVVAHRECATYRVRRLDRHGSRRY